MIMSTSTFGPDHASLPPTKPIVTAVVVNYRTPEETIDAVRSLQRLHYPELRIIVVDNDSGDGSAERLEEVLGSENVRRASSNGGYTEGNNIGIEEALREGADYVLVINPDTVVHNLNFLTDLVDHAERHPRAGAIGPRVFLRSSQRVQNTVLRFPWLWHRAWGFLRGRLASAPLRSGEEATPVDVLNGVCVLFRAEALFDVGPFDARTFAYIEDVDWAWRAQKLGWQRWYLPIDSIIHLQRISGYEMGSRVDFLLKRNTLYFLLKNGHRLQAAAYTAVTLSLGAWRRTQGRLAQDSWLSRLAEAYRGLWRGDFDGVMGRPTL